MKDKDFNNEDNARRFRDTKRQEGLASSVFTYGEDRFRVKTWEKWPTTPERTQPALSSMAYEHSQDVEDLNKMKEIISSPKFINYDDYESILFVARKLDSEHWFSNSRDVIEFLEYPDKQLDKIQKFVDEALQEYDDAWNDKTNVTTEEEK